MVYNSFLPKEETFGRGSICMNKVKDPTNSSNT